MPAAEVERRAFVHEAELWLAGGVDPAAVGAAVTVALCGHWEHEGACRWAHTNEIRGSGESAGDFAFRTLFVATEADEPEVRARIERALRSAEVWRVRRSGARPPAASEAGLAAGLLRAPGA